MGMRRTRRSFGEGPIFGLWECNDGVREMVARADRNRGEKHLKEMSFHKTSLSGSMTPSKPPRALLEQARSHGARA